MSHAALQLNRSESFKLGHSEIELETAELDVREQVGGGGFSLVYRALFHGAPVAVKKWFDPDHTAELLADFQEEVEVLRRVRHPNIVQVIGACTKPPNLHIVFEYIPNTLHSVLHESSMEMDRKRIVAIMTDAVRAFRYLHTRKPPIVHRDIKPSNFLVTRAWNIKLCDFGLASRNKAPTAGTPAYMAPELHAGDANYGPAVDVYALGVLLCEVACRQVPFDGLSALDIRNAVLNDGERPKVTLSCPRAFKTIFESCWSKDASARPSAEALFDLLKDVPTTAV